MAFFHDSETTESILLRQKKKEWKEVGEKFTILLILSLPISIQQLLAAAAMEHE